MNGQEKLIDFYEEKFIDLYEKIVEFCKKNKLGDPFSYARGKEIYAAAKLGHTVAPTLSGPDAYNQSGDPVEYKSTTGKSIKGSYTGISVQKSWDEQVKYLKEEKILPYKEHYFNRFDGGKLVEAWRLSGQDVYNILLPKIEKSFRSAGQRKDPRISANITKGEIKKYGKRII